MKYLALLLLISCATEQVSSPISRPPSKPKAPPVKVGSCFISSVSDSVYKILRCNYHYCEVKNELFSTVMEREYVSQQLTADCPKGLK